MTMARRFAGGTLVIATHNPGKLREIADLLEPFGAHTVSAAALGLAAPNETGASFTANAELKARAAAEASGHPALADDSGLVVPALGGQPGIHSARWAGEAGDISAAMARIQGELAAGSDRDGRDDRGAWFACALALAWPDGHCETFEGRVDGTLVWPPRGEKGFGYDPMFAANGHTETFGEMAPAAKHGISHRADAFAKLTNACFED
jgi:XTP/dITP diphosphohydrolase